MTSVSFTFGGFLFFFFFKKKKKKQLEKYIILAPHCIGQPFENRNGPTLAGFEMVAGVTREQGQGLGVALSLWGEEGRPLGALWVPGVMSGWRRRVLYL